MLFPKRPWQLAPFSEFGAEFGFVDGDRRMRFVQLYDKGLSLASLTFIREFRRGSDAQERPALKVEQLLGTWQCQVYTGYPDWREPELSTMEISLSQTGDSVEQRVTVQGQTSVMQGKVMGDQIHFLGPNPSKVLLLPDGASSCTPIACNWDNPFRGKWAGWCAPTNDKG
ncbi:DUF3598 family protein [Synechocystis sp. B12]|nr:DUF3598 family protein [Synechocystis sp. B12]